MSSPVVTPKQLNEDRYLDSTLRPRSFDEYMGQQKIKDNLRILIEAAKKRGEAIDHLLLCGPSGLGKTSLAHIIAKEMGVSIKITSGPAIEKVGDLASILTNLQPGDILFCDESHRLNKTIEETLYPAMEDFVLDIIIGKGPSARTLQLELPRFTFIGATTRLGLISSPLRSRFGATYRLNFYEQPDIEKIIARSAQILKVSIDQDQALKTIAQSARQTPRVANRLLKRVRDYSQVRADGIINSQIAQEALKMLEVDELGLEPADRRLLRIMIEKFNGGPVGLQALAAASQEEPETIADVHEPYLLQLGFLDRTPRGRIATKVAYQHLNLKYNQQEQDKLL
jgi:Holliday junction DNA helicase RuvB